VFSCVRTFAGFGRDAGVNSETLLWLSVADVTTFLVVVNVVFFVVLAAAWERHCNVHHTSAFYVTTAPQY